MSDNTIKEGFCIRCGFLIEYFQGLKCCPACKTTIQPCDYKYQMDININYRELRALVHWSEAYIAHVKNEKKQADMMMVLRTIIARINRQNPNKIQLAQDTIEDQLGGI